MNRINKSVFAILLILAMLCSTLAAPLEALAFDPALDIYLDGTQNYIMAAEVLKIMNEERAEAGLPALTADPVMMDYAMQRAAEIYVYYSHTRPDGSDCFSVFGKDYRYDSLGENIAIGYVSAADVMDGWMNSPGHRANILSEGYNSVGIGCFYQPDGSIGWVQLFYSGTCQESETRNHVQQVTDVGVSIKVSNLVGYVEHHTFSNAYCAAYLYEGSTIGTNFYLINSQFTYQKIHIKMDEVKYATSDSAVFTVNNNDYTVTATGVGKAFLSVLFRGWQISMLDDAGYVNDEVSVEVMEKPALSYSFDDRGNILVDYSAFNSSLNLFYRGNWDDMWTMANREADGIYTHYNPDPTETYVYVMRYYDPYLDENVEIGDRLVVKLGNEDPKPDPGQDPEPDPDPGSDVALPQIPDLDVEPTVEQAQQTLAGLKEICAPGATWSTDSYTWLGGALDVLDNEATGYGDMAFCMALSDRVFGDLPARVIYDVKLDDLRPGDILMDSVLGNLLIVDMAQNYLYCATVSDGTIRYHLLSPANYEGYVTCALVRYESQAPGAAAINPSPVPENAEIVAAGEANYAKTYMGQTTYYAIIDWALDAEGTLYFHGMGGLKRYSHSGWAGYYDQVKRVVFGDQITQIDSYAFERWEQLEEVVLGADVDAIGDYAFHGCSGLRTVSFPDALTEIGNYAFYGCALAEADFAEGLLVIGQDAFGENSIETLRLPDSLVTLGGGAFSNNTKLVSLYIPASLREMGDYVFSGCTALSQLELAEGITVLGNYAFSHCESITDVTLPGTLTEIPEGLFQFSGLEILRLEKGVQLIRERAFYFCRNITSIYAYNTLTIIGDYAFDGCEQIWDVYFYGSYEQWYAIQFGANNWFLEMFAMINCLDPDVCTHQNVAVIPGQAPTCTEDGLSEGQICEDCGQILLQQETLAATGHSYGAWQTVTEPGEYTEGLEQRNCQNCDHYETRAIPALGHTHNYEEVLIAPTCTEPGCVIYTCRCGDSYTEELPATGHSYVDGHCQHCGEPEAKLGDINGDGKVNARDARLLLRYLAGLTEEGEVDVSAADFNGDGRVNARDARAILQALAGIG